MLHHILNVLLKECWGPHKGCLGAECGPQNRSWEPLVYMNWIDSRSRVDEDVIVRSWSINRLLFADDLILLAQGFRNCHNIGICLSEGVHVYLAIEGKNMLIHYSFPIIYISECNEHKQKFFKRGQRCHLLYLFRMLSMKCKWMFTNHFILFTAQRKCPMLWQQWRKMRFVGSHSQVYYDNFHHRLCADFHNRALFFT